MWQAAAALARWYRFQPSEIDALTLEELRLWLAEAARQAKAEAEK
ncbi:MAG: GpE family phage tail protein [Deltaproteobacteria bacterium]|nr:GpE family phage tail protein [Deltaproteobacteria bacterium]